MYIDYMNALIENQLLETNFDFFPSLNKKSRDELKNNMMFTSSDHMKYWSLIWCDKFIWASKLHSIVFG